jgi:DNA-binding GntR family transcriptional regulator
MIEPEKAPHDYRPKYVRIVQDLTKAMDDGTYPAGTRLPTGPELATAYECSLMTVRYAMRELTVQGRISAQRGVGTFVK